jgi:hypothetical protein
VPCSEAIHEDLRRGFEKVTFNLTGRGAGRKLKRDFFAEHRRTTVLTSALKMVFPALAGKGRFAAPGAGFGIARLTRNFEIAFLRAGERVSNWKLGNTMGRLAARRQK